MATPIDGIMRGLMGGGRGKVSLMPTVGGMSGGGGAMRGGGSAPAIPSLASGGGQTSNARSLFGVGEDWLAGKLKEWLPTPQEKQARTNADLFAQALIGGEGSPGLLGAQITPELLAQAAGNMRQGGADARGILDLVGYAVPAMNQQQEMAWRKQRAEAEDKKLEAWLANMNARTASSQAATARANAKAGGASSGGGVSSNIW